MTIYKAILKYGYANFKLEILEYCNPDVLITREQYYIDLLKPKYNILSIAGSTFGYKHTAKTLEKFKTREFSYETLTKLTEAAKGRVLSKEVRAKISVARTGVKLSEETRAKLSAIGAARGCSRSYKDNFW
jgi:group I intron endonuclease